MIPQTWHMAVTLSVLALTVLCFISGRVRADLVALCALLALVITGVLTPPEALSGFSNSVLFVMAGMFVISGAIVRTGLASAVSKRILAVAGKNTHVLFFLIVLLAALIGSMVSNTGTVAIMLPIVVSLAVSIDKSPGRFLMPLAFMSSIGGMFTLIGNSPNMIANDAYVRAGCPTLGLFSFFPVGVISFLFGMLILAPATSWYLSRKGGAAADAGKRRLSLGDLVNKYRLAQHTYTLTIPAGSPVTKKPLRDLRLSERNGVMVMDIARPEPQPGVFHLRGRKTVQITPGPDTLLAGGDIVTILCTRDDAEELAQRHGLELPAEGCQPPADGFRFVTTGICELVLMSASRLINHTVAESGLRQQFGLTVLGIQRADKYILDRVKDRTLRAGDALLVQGAWDRLAQLDAESPDWVVVGRPMEETGARRFGNKMPLVAAVLALMILSMAFNLLPTVVAVVLAALVLVFGGCYRTADEAYRTINWETLVLIAGLMPIAMAMDKTGVEDILADWLVARAQAHGPHAALGLIYGLASFLNILISTTPVALLASPVAMQIAQTLGYSPLPFLFAVATASSMCFASPFSTPANALVMSAGRYTFGDYMKVGLPLQILMGAVMTFALPLLYPF